MFASSSGHEQVARALLEAEASLFLLVVSKDNFTMLMDGSKFRRASFGSQSASCHTVWSTQQSYPRTPAREGGYSALIYSSMQGKAEVVENEMLLHAGADKGLRSTGGARALSLAQDGNHEAVLQIVAVMCALT